MVSIVIRSDWMHNWQCMAVKACGHDRLAGHGEVSLCMLRTYYNYEHASQHTNVVVTSKINSWFKARLIRNYYCIDGKPWVYFWSASTQLRKSLRVGGPKFQCGSKFWISPWDMCYTYTQSSHTGKLVTQKIATLSSNKSGRGHYQAFCSSRDFGTHPKYF